MRPSYVLEHPLLGSRGTVRGRSLGAGGALMTDRSSNAGCLAGGGAFYTLGIIGSWVYFWQQADSFWEYVGAIFQGFVWPAFMVYDLFVALGR